MNPHLPPSQRPEIVLHTDSPWWRIILALHNHHNIPLDLAILGDAGLLEAWRADDMDVIPTVGILDFMGRKAELDAIVQGRGLDFCHYDPETRQSLRALTPPTLAEMLAVAARHRQ